MNMDKLCEVITTRPDLRDIPLSHIFKVAYAIFDEIRKGTCFFDKEEAECLSSITPTPLEEE